LAELAGLADVNGWRVVLVGDPLQTRHLRRGGPLLHQLRHRLAVDQHGGKANLTGHGDAAVGMLDTVEDLAELGLTSASGNMQNPPLFVLTSALARKSL
jgi:hypothetical protein